MNGDHKPDAAGLVADAMSRVTMRRLGLPDRHIQLEPQQALFVQGDEPDSVFVVLEGSVRLTVVARSGLTRAVGEVRAGAFVGQLGLITGAGQGPRPRWATAMGGDDGAKVLRLVPDELLTLLDQNTSLGAELDHCTELRLASMRHELGGLFGRLPAEIWLDLQAVVDLRHVPGGEVLIHKGDVGDGLFVVATGLLAVHQDGPTSRRIALLGPGQPVGEAALLSGQPRGATVSALRDSLVLRLSKADFDGVIQGHPAAALPLLQTLARRVSDSSGAVRPASAHAVAVVPVDGSARVMSTARELVGALSACGRGISAEDVDRKFGAGSARARTTGVNMQAITRWMSEQEQARGNLAFLADPADTTWTRRCLRQSDRVLVVADAAADPAPGGLERVLTTEELTDRSGPPTLVLVHAPDAAFPRGTARWLDPRPGSQHFHLRCGHDADRDRLVRMVTGRGRGLVLGGGGARGFAHVGLLRALAELELPVDIVCGASMGAMIAAGVAMEYPAERCGRHLRELMIDSGVRRAITLPFTALLRTDGIDAIARRIADGLDIEDLWRPFFALSANLSRYQLQTHERGVLWRALRASCAIPALIPPSLAEGDVLVDGGVLDNLPVGPMSERTAGPILASDVTSVPTMRADPELEDVPSGGRLLWQRFLPRSKRKRVPTITSVITHSLVCSSVMQRRAALQRADLVLQPDVASVGLLQFERYEELEEAGYRAAMERAEELTALLRD